MHNAETFPISVEIKEAMHQGYETILTKEALRFLADLTAKFKKKRDQLLSRRQERYEQWRNGVEMDFLAETEEIRKGDWQVAPIPKDLLDRRVEITGPANDRKMVINALNSGAKGFMADFEDSMSPTWRNVVEGQIHLRDAVNRTIEHVTPKKIYRLNEETAVLMVRPRGLHLDERRVLVNGEPIPASLFDFGLYLFHNARTLIDQGSGPYFYLPKLESHLEARWWKEVFEYSEKALQLPLRSIRATVLIETLPSVFEVDEILYELREYSAGLNCGRWDYIFSYIKRRNHLADVLLPDRALVTMGTPFMRAYTTLTIQVCHKRNIHCIGGMAAHIPRKDDEQANRRAIDQVIQDKTREVTDGHDGCWVAHPGLVQPIKQVFDQYMTTPNQLKKQIQKEITAKDLLQVPVGSITEEGLRTNLSVGVQYLESWLRGRGAVAINYLMEDLATAEISRAQIWHWLNYPHGVFIEGKRVNEKWVRELLDEEMKKLKSQLGEDENNKLLEAKELLEELIFNEECLEFINIVGERYLVK